MMQATKKILVVEDEGLIAANICSQLERLGYAVPATADTGEDALRLARSTPFDLVLMDIRIKADLDGIATARILHDELQTPVVYLTAHADQETVDRATVTEPLGYIVKPGPMATSAAPFRSRSTSTRWKSACAPAKCGSPLRCAV